MGKRVDKVPTPLGAQGQEIFNVSDEKSKPVGAHELPGSSNSFCTGDKVTPPSPKEYCTDCLALHEAVLRLMDHCHKCHVPREDLSNRGTTHCVVSPNVNSPNSMYNHTKAKIRGNGQPIDVICNHPNKSDRVGAKLGFEDQLGLHSFNSPPQQSSTPPSSCHLLG